MNKQKLTESFKKMMENRKKENREKNKLARKTRRKNLTKGSPGRNKRLI